MLRLRRLPRLQPRAALAPSCASAPRLPLAGRWQPQPPQQQRLLWSRTADLMSWMGLKEKKAAAADAAQAQAVEEEEEKEVEAKEAEEEAAEEGATATDAKEEAQKAPSRKRRIVTAGALEVDVAAGAARDVKRATLALQRYVYAAKGDKTQLLALWTTARSFRPFVLQDGAAREWVAPPPAESDGDGNGAEKRPQVLQLLPLDAFVDVTQRIQALEIGTPACFSGRRVDASSSDDDATPVVFVSEKTLLRQLVRALAGCRGEEAHREGTQLFEQYQDERRATIDALLARASAADAESSAPTRAQLEDWTRLTKDTYAAYIDVLEALGQHRQVIAFFEMPGHIQQYLGAPQTLRKLLKACLAESRGDVARRALDAFHAHFPWLVVSKNSYQMAMQACYKSGERKKTPEQLANALHVYTLMTHGGAGYIVYPNIWSALFNACVYAEHRDDAVALFGTYAAQRIAPFQHRFTQALRTACKLQQYDTAVAMVRTWVDVETANAVAAQAATTSSILDNQATRQQHAKASRAECECFNKVLWEMLKGEPSLAQLTLVLRAMEQRQAPAGAQVIRLLVARYLSPQSDSETPRERMQRMLALWDEVPRVIERNAFVVHLLLDQCLAVSWERECEELVAFAVAHEIELPMGSLVKIMEAWDEQGRTDKVAAFAQSLLRSLGDAARARLSQSFFEVFLMSLLRAQRFGDILALNAELTLTTRFPKSHVLLMIVKDATNA